ncbi:transcription initiation factor TFIID subunit 10 [Scaptodrosophila lebanonensis]|uniref:Transcription initiation factor TFIID subunit 10 n=1 Tax=Drosophila lebanonensis TaxID=7225 RepID=A0A6J2U6J0_DROLE|nr:transcription initiation factor TFIID subunit 10 [Scaptodrosophila lebanonensis]
MATQDEHMDTKQEELETVVIDSDEIRDEPETDSHSETETDEESFDLDVVPVPAAQEEADLDELLTQLEDYMPTVADALTQRVLNTAGFGTIDPRIVRIISVTAQKFIADIANDALQHCKTRTTNIQHSSGHGSNKDKKNPKDRKYTLTMDDLLPALLDHGITMRKPQYFV